MFDLPESKMITPDEVKTSHEVGTVEDCQEIQDMYKLTEKLIDEGEDNINDKMMKSTLHSHRLMIEARTDWDMCQKTVRRRRIISMWHNTQVFKKNSKDKQ
jgi:N-glycosylase/DNA lyase